MHIGKNRLQYLRSQVATTEETTATEDTITLTQPQFLRFIKILNNPPEPSRAMKDLGCEL